ncbi:MAG: alpha/beta hydrolase family protein [Phycisphaerae bacterium]
MPPTANRYPQMVQEYYVNRFRQVHEDRLRRRAKLRTRKDVLKLQADLRAKVRECFGPMPERTPLNARVTGALDLPAFRIEKVIFESRPGFMVTANLYLPKAPPGKGGKYPCVLGTCGHSEDGKANEPYQSYAQGLAMRGFVVLVFDPISQGERVQYPNAEGKCTQGLCSEHTTMGVQQALLGEFFGAWRAWDGIRALDYLLSRPEADPSRVGVTGNSGGGTMTTWLAGLDERFTMAAPGCFVTTNLHNMENELAADAEQMIPNLLASGMDQYELFIPFAPRPLILLTAANDFFDQRGSQEAFRELRRTYKLLGAEDNVRIFTGPGTHGFARELREAMYAFFTRHAGVKAPAAEEGLAIQKPADLFATPTGSTLKEGSRRVFDFTSDAALAVTKQRKPVPAGKLADKLRRMLALPQRHAVAHHRVPIFWSQQGWRRQTYGLETEPGIMAIVTLPLPEGTAFQPPRGEDCTLLVAHNGGYDDLAPGVIRPELLNGHGRLFAVDVRGLGESASNSCGGSLADTHSCDYFFDSNSLMLGQPYLGGRVHDVLCTLDWLASYGYRRIHLVGRGHGAIPALMAAVVYEHTGSPILSSSRSPVLPSSSRKGRKPGQEDGRKVVRAKLRVTILNGLMSYLEITQEPIFSWPSAALLRAALVEFDLPDCYRALAGRVAIEKPWDGMMKEITPDQARQRARELGIDPGVIAG